MVRFAPPAPDTRRRAARFLAVGGGSAAVQFAVLALLRDSMGGTAAFSVSWFLSTATHYVANRFWALPSARTDSGRQLGEYLFAVGLSYLINLAAFKVCTVWLGVGVMWSAFWAIPPSTVVVFLILNYRVFRGGRGEG